MANGDGTKLTADDIKLLAQAQKYEKETTAERFKRLEIEKQTLDTAVKLAQSADQTVKAAFLINEQRLKELEHAEAKLHIEREAIKAHLAAGKALDENIKKALEKLKVDEEIVKKQIEATHAIEATEAQTKNWAKILTGVGDQWKDTFIGGFVKSSQTLDGLGQRMTRFKGQLKDTFTLANILGSALQRVAQSTLALAKEQDAAIASFNKATSTMGEYADQLIAIERANIGLGVSTGDAAGAFGALITNVTTFRDAGSAMQAQLAQTAAQMEKLGVSTQLTAQTMENAMLVLGMTEEQSMGLTSSLADMAIQMNLPIEQVTENFNAAMPVLAKFGRDAPDVFRKVQVASRSLGVAVGELIGVMSQFDTFEGAASSAGKLNAILGGDLLNSTELLMASEDERLRMVREAIAASGRQFESMDRFEKMAVASALGVRDMSVATKMLTGDMDRFGGALDATGLTEEETAERIRATQDITQKLSNTFRMFAISMRPLVDGFHKFINFIFDANQAMKNLLVPLLLVVGGIAAIMTAPATGGGSLAAFAAYASKIMGGAAIVTGALGGTSALMEGFAEGGPVGAGRPIVVGESGPEVFVPGADGAIRRNEDFRRMPAMQPQAMAAAPTQSKPRDLTVIVELDKRELGRGVIKAIDEVPGYNIKGVLDYA